MYVCMFVINSEALGIIATKRGSQITTQKKSSRYPSLLTCKNKTTNTSIHPLVLGVVGTNHDTPDI